MKCNICGTEFPEGVNFCPTCGTKTGEEMPVFNENTQAAETQTPAAETAPTQDITTEMPTVENAPIENAPAQTADTQTAFAQVAETQTAETDFAQGSVAQTAPAKKGNKGLVIGVCAGIAAAVAVIVLCVCLLFSSPISTVGKALAATASAIEKEQSTASAKKPVTIVMNALKNKPMQTDMKLDITEIGGMASSGMLSFDFNLNTDIKAKKLASKIDATIFGYEFTFDTKADENTLGFNIPQLFDGYYGMETTRIYEDSIAATYENEFDFVKDTNFEMFQTVPTDKPVKVITEKTQKDIIDNLKVFKKTIVVERCNETKSTDLNGTDTKCKEYVATCKASDCQKIISTVFTLLSEDELYSAEIEKALATGEYTYDEFEDEFFTMLDIVFDNADEKMNVSFFIQNGKVVKIASVIDFGDAVTDFGIELGDGKTLTDVMSADLKLFDTENDDKMHISLVSKGNHSGKDNSYSDETKFKMSVSTLDEPLKLTFKTEYDFDKEEDNFDFNCKMAIPDDDEYKLNLTGTLAADKGKNIINGDFENATVIYGDKTMLACDINYEIKNLNVKESGFIKKDEITNIFKMQQSDIDKVLQEMQDNAMENYSTLIDLFGSMMYGR